MALYIPEEIERIFGRGSAFHILTFRGNRIFVSRDRMEDIYGLDVINKTEFPSLRIYRDLKVGIKQKTYLVEIEGDPFEPVSHAYEVTSEKNWDGCIVLKPITDSEIIEILQEQVKGRLEKEVKELEKDLEEHLYIQDEPFFYCV